MNKYMGWLMIFISGFFIALNLTELLPHADSINAGWDKVCFAIGLGVVGFFWCRQE